MSKLINIARNQNVIWNSELRVGSNILERLGGFSHFEVDGVENIRASVPNFFETKTVF